MVDVVPLKTLEDLWEWNSADIPTRLKAIPLEQYRESLNDQVETLICHDMKGGYQSEDSEEGMAVDAQHEPFSILHWWYIDIFVYFSHHLVTIPPVCWTNAGHRHGTLVLGTFITEWQPGAAICHKMLSSKISVSKTVEKLVGIAVGYNFDGWLLNFENKIEESDLENLRLFVQDLTTEMKRALGDHSRVIWYDSVTVGGRLDWQNQLNAENCGWLNDCDGLFLNYTWDEAGLRSTSRNARGRRSKVYVGIDCFGRGCPGGGGWNCAEAAKLARLEQLSIALFAPGWIYQNFGDNCTASNLSRFWQLLSPFLFPRFISHLPFRTDFSVGYSKDGKCFNRCQLRPQPHYLSSSSIEPAHGDHGLKIKHAGIHRILETDLTIRDRAVAVHLNSTGPIVLVAWDDECRCVMLGSPCSGQSTWILAIDHVMAIGLICTEPIILRSIQIESPELSSGQKKSPVLSSIQKKSPQLSSDQIDFNGERKE